MLARDCIRLPFLLAGCFAFHSSIAPDEATEESANPWLRPHFTVSIKSSESFDVVKSIPVDSGIRKGFPDGLFAKLVEAVHPGLPAGISFSRTYLRCMPLGWRYGGHSIDRLAMDSIDFEGSLLTKGNMLQDISGSDSLLKAINNQFVLGQKGQVATLRVPGGFEGKYSDIRIALQHSLDVSPDVLATADWSIKFRISELIDKAYWEAIQAGLASAIQSADQTNALDLFTRKECGLTAIALLELIANDVESCELKADFDRDTHAGTVSLILESKANGSFRRSLASLSEVSISDPAAAGNNDDFVILGMSRIPRHSLFSDLASRLTSQVAPAHGRSAEAECGHAMFGIRADRGSEANAFVVFCETQHGLPDFHSSQFNAVVLFPIQAANRSPQLSAAAPNTLTAPEFWAAFYMQQDKIAANTPIVHRSRWMSARLRILQCVPLFFPSLTVPTHQPTLADDSVRVEGIVDGTRLVIIAHCPPNSDQYIYLLFESVLDALQSLSKSLPFGDMSPE